MARRDVTTPTLALLEQGIFYWPSLKIDNLLFTHNNIQLVYNNSFKEKITKEEVKKIKTLIELEIVITTLHCAEILASYLLVFKKQRKTIQYEMFRYKVGEVKKFYEAINSKKNPHLARMFSYPQPYKVEGEKTKELIRESCTKIKANLVEIANYYNQNIDLYNSYKHGMRISSFLSGENIKDSHGIIGYLIPHKDKNQKPLRYPAKVTLIRIDYNKAVGLTRIITSLLLNSKENFTNKIIKKKVNSIILY